MDKHNSLARRLARFILVIGLALTIVYGLLPLITKSFSITRRMAVSLENTEIDPSRYYYTDVEQVLESELYLRSVLSKNNGIKQN